MSKTHISIRIDDEVIDWLKRKSPRYQSKINTILVGHVRRAKNKVRKARKAARK